jgi:hypothetical protein
VWTDIEGQEFTINDYIINAVNCWEIHYTQGMRTISVPRSFFEDCTFFMGPTTGP